MIRLLAGAVVLLLLVAAHLVYPFHVISSAAKAIKHRDAATLEAMIDFPSVRESLKSDFRGIAMMSGTGDISGLSTLRDQGVFSGLGSMIGAAMGLAAVDRFIDGAVNPIVLPKLLDNVPDDLEPKRYVARTVFTSLTEIRIDLARPDKPACRMALHLAMRGLSWKLVRISAPAELLVGYPDGTREAGCP